MTTDRGTAVEAGKLSSNWRQRLPRLVVGYLIAIFVTSFLSYAGTMLITEFYRHPPPNFLSFVRQIAITLPFALFMTMLYILVPLMLAGLATVVLALPAIGLITYAEKRNIRSLWSHCLGGTILALIFAAYAYFASPQAKGTSSTGTPEVLEALEWILLASVFGGCCAGFIYWLIVVRFARCAN
jgi:hypothetical protein